MNFDYIHKKYVLDKEALKKYGFCEKAGEFFAEKPLKTKDFVARIRISEKVFDIDLFDTDAQSEYFLTNVDAVEGSFVNSLKQQVFALRDDVTSKCFSSVSVKGQVIDFMKSRYGAEPEFPWKDDDSCIFRVENSTKWFGLIMTIPAQRLGVGGKESIDVLNLKHDPFSAPSLFDGKNVFPAYHMNKVHWISVVLDKNIAFEKIIQLICESHDLVANKK